MIYMTKDGKDLYLEDTFMQQPNHDRVVRMLHEMEYVPHRDRRHGDVEHGVEQRSEKSFLLSLVDKLMR
jgi:hypothetical protein